MESPDQKRLRNPEPVEVEGVEAMTSAEYEEYERFLAEPFPEDQGDRSEQVEDDGDIYIPVGRSAERERWKELGYDK